MSAWTHNAHSSQRRTRGTSRACRRCLSCACVAALSLSLTRTLAACLGHKVPRASCVRSVRARVIRLAAPRVLESAFQEVKETSVVSCGAALESAFWAGTEASWSSFASCGVQRGRRRVVETRTIESGKPQTVLHRLKSRDRPNRTLETKPYLPSRERKVKIPVGWTQASWRASYGEPGDAVRICASATGSWECSPGERLSEIGTSLRVSIRLVSRERAYTL